MSHAGDTASEPAARPRGAVGAVIVAHDRADAATACVEAVSREINLTDVVVVVNRPDLVPGPDLTQLQRRVPHVVLAPYPGGYGANANLGVSLLSPQLRYLLILNDDALVRPNAISTLCEVLDSRPTIGLVGPQLVDVRGNAQPSWFEFPTLGSELRSALMLPAFMNRASEYGVFDESVTRADGWPIGAALLVRSDAFRAVGGFDERYFLYSEELDLAFRLRKSGWASAFCADATIQHAGAQSTRGDYDRMLGLSRWRFIRTHWSPPARAALVAGLVGVYAWNALYITTRVVTNPRSAREKLEWWRARWTKRPLPR